MNYKDIGEMGQNCVIGELSKYCMGVAPLLSDNYPFEMIAIAGKNLFKIQVKTSTTNKNGEHITFDLTTNNWLRGTKKKYNKEDCDIIILYDLVEHKCFLLSPDDFENKGSFTIRYKKAKSNKRKGINWYEDYIISNKRIKEVLDFDVPDITVNFSTKKKKYNRVCQYCKINFDSTYKHVKCCSSKCKGLITRKVVRPSKEELKEMIDTTSFLQIGKKYCVSDNAVRKWAISYELI